MKLFKSIAFLTIALVAQTSFAHFQIGKYEGTLMNGEKCQFNITNVEFDKGVHHPLNERVGMTIDFKNTENLEFRHLVNVDAAQGTIRPKHGVLSSVIPFAGGASAFELIMNEEGPVQMIYFTDNYKNPDANERITCADLKYIGQ